MPRLAPILEKDSVRRFLRLINQEGRGMGWGFIITPQTFNQMILQNALRCAKVVLEGKDPELHGFRANPNCMNRFGFFPLHQAAEIFSVDMIKLLFEYNASANVRTSGTQVIENLLPLHVAVENTCLHKYLEDNAFPNQDDLDSDYANIKYVCKLIHLLCLPEMVCHIHLLSQHNEGMFTSFLKPLSPQSKD
jgi:ankyrin repeat protein